MKQPRQPLNAVKLNKNFIWAVRFGFGEREAEILVTALISVKHLFGIQCLDLLVISLA